MNGVKTVKNVKDTIRFERIRNMLSILDVNEDNVNFDIKAYTNLYFSDLNYFKVFSKQFVHLNRRLYEDTHIIEIFLPKLQR